MMGIPSGYLLHSHGFSMAPNRNRWFTELKHGWVFPWRNHHVKVLQNELESPCLMAKSTI